MQQEKLYKKIEFINGIFDFHQTRPSKLGSSEDNYDPKNDFYAKEVYLGLLEDIVKERSPSREQKKTGYPGTRDTGYNVATLRALYNLKNTNIMQGKTVKRQSSQAELSRAQMFNLTAVSKNKLDEAILRYESQLKPSFKRIADKILEKIRYELKQRELELKNSALRAVRPDLADEFKTTIDTFPELREEYPELADKYNLNDQIRSTLIYIGCYKIALKMEGLNDEDIETKVKPLIERLKKIQAAFKDNDAGNDYTPLPQ